jgi:hypothetical protein
MYVLYWFVLELSSFFIAAFIIFGFQLTGLWDTVKFAFLFLRIPTPLAVATEKVSTCHCISLSCVSTHACMYVSVYVVFDVCECVSWALGTRIIFIAFI